MEDVYIGFRELTPSDQTLPSLRESIQEMPYPEKAKIIRFLKTGHCFAARAGYDVDYFTGKIIPQEALILEHGNYFWGSSLAYYVDKYNVRLPKDIEHYILSQYTQAVG